MAADRDRHADRRVLEAASAQGAALALVLAIDVSASVTANSYLLQREGIARAFAIPRLVEAISGAPGGIEVLVLEWSDPDKIVVTVDWPRVGDAPSAAAFAAAVHASQRSSNGLTAIGPALLAAAEPSTICRSRPCAESSTSPGTGWRISACRRRWRATGSQRLGSDQRARILTQEPWLADYYRSNVIGGPSAFVVAARTFDDFADAMLRKLMQEIASAPGRFAQMQ